LQKLNESYFMVGEQVDSGSANFTIFSVPDFQIVTSFTSELDIVYPVVPYVPLGFGKSSSVIEGVIGVNVTTGNCVVSNVRGEQGFVGKQDSAEPYLFLVNQDGSFWMQGLSGYSLYEVLSFGNEESMNEKLEIYI
jgi:hypothetical protein